MVDAEVVVVLPLLAVVPLLLKILLKVVKLEDVKPVTGSLPAGPVLIRGKVNEMLSYPEHD